MMSTPEPVGPVELARHLHLDVLAQPVQADLPGAQHLVAHERVAREGVEAVGVIRLVERQLEVHGLVVERDVGMVRAGQVHDRDLAHAEVGVDDVRPRPRPGQARLDLVEERILRATTGAASGIATSNRDAGLAPRDRGAPPPATPPVRERQAQRQVLGRRPRAGGPPPSPSPASMSGVKCSGGQRRRAARLEVRRLPDAARVAVALLAFELERAVRVVDAEGQALRRARTARAASARTRTACSRPGARRASARRARPWSASRRRRSTRKTRSPLPAPTGSRSCGRTRRSRRWSGTPESADPQGNGTVMASGKSASPCCHAWASPSIVRVEAELPRAVQVHPGRALEVGARVLRQRDVLLSAGGARQQNGCRERR